MSDPVWCQLCQYPPPKCDCTKDMLRAALASRDAEIRCLGKELGEVRDGLRGRKEQTDGAWEIVAQRDAQLASLREALTECGATLKFSEYDGTSMLPELVREGKRRVLLARRALALTDEAKPGQAMNRDELVKELERAAFDLPGSVMAAINHQAAAMLREDASLRKELGEVREESDTFWEMAKSNKTTCDALESQLASLRKSLDSKGEALERIAKPAQWWFDELKILPPNEDEMRAMARAAIATEVKE